MSLPLKLIKFWYPDALSIFLRCWHNTLSLLEEDLAVGLMWRLLFTPLFHDNSITGRLMSIGFRLSRIGIGLGAYFLATLFIVIIAFAWFLTPVLLFIPGIWWLGVLTLLFGLALFIDRIVAFPEQKIWHIKTAPEVLKTTKLKRSEITWDYLLKTDEVKSLLKSLEIHEGFFGTQNVTITDVLCQKVWDLAKFTGAPYTTAAYFWVAMLEQLSGIEQELLKINLTTADFEYALNYLELKRRKWRMIFVWDEDFALTHLKGVNRGWLSAPTPVLDSISTDLTKGATKQSIHDFIGRDATVAQVINILSQSRDRNCLLVGPPGSGKSALVSFLAKKIINGDAPESLATKRLVALDISKLLSGVQTEGDLADKIKNAFEEVKAIEDIIIYVDEIHNLGLGDAGHQFNLFALMIPYLESNEFQFIASTESENYAKILEKNGSLARLFHKVEVPPSSIEDTMKIIEERSIYMARYEKTNLSVKAIQEIVQLAGKYIHDRVLPDSALSLLTEVASSNNDGEITSTTVKEVMSQRVHVPVVEVDANQSELLLNLEDVIHQKFIDQQQAVKAVSNTLRRASTDLREQNRPIGSFLFVGPTGVGKTELAKLLSEIYFKTDGAFVRFDMSEYQTPDAVHRLIGDDTNPGELTEAIKNKPYALLLLDEFEKANPQILNLFLQVFDDGRLTDSSGKTIDFTSTIIIATSNAASLTIAQGLQAGKEFSEVEKEVKEELLKVFKPELVNRFDDIVIFKPLSQVDLEKIVRIKLADLQLMLKKKGYLVEFNDGLVSLLAEKGFDPVLGARPLRRLIQDSIESKLSRLILEGKLPKGEVFTLDMNHLLF